MQLYLQVDQDIYIGKKYWEGTLDSPIKVAKFYFLGNENSLKFSERWKDVLKTVISVLRNAV